MNQSTKPISPLHQTLNALEKFSDRFYEKPLLDYLDGINKYPLKILEIGSGWGAVTEALLAYGQITATDSDSEAIIRLRDKFKNTPQVQIFHWNATHCPSIAGSPLPISEGNYDVIVAFNVLEHLADHEKVLAQWTGLLAPQGQLLLLVPFAPSLYNSLDVALGHMRRYTREDLRRILPKLGGIVVKQSFVNPLGILGWFFNGRVLKRNYLPEGQVKLYHTLKNFLRPVELLLGRVMGLSIFAVIKLKEMEV